jgi:hypothetical protein
MDTDEDARRRGLAVVGGVGGLALTLLGALLTRAGGVLGVAGAVLLLVAVLGVLAGLVALRRGAGRVQLSPAGLVRARGGGRVDAVRWDQVAELRRAPGPVLTLRRGDGDLVTFGPELGAELDRVIAAAERGVTSARLPGAEAALRSGGEVRFGTLTARPAGLDGDGWTVAWRRVARIALVGDDVVVTATGPAERLATPVADVPGYCVLIALAAGLTTPQRR